MSFLPGLFPGPVMAAEKAASIVYADSTGSTTNEFGYTFSNRNLGTADPTRVLIAFVEWSFLLGGTFGSFMIDGVPMTSQGAPLGGAFFTLAWPTGATGTITVTSTSGKFIGVGFTLWAAYNLKSQTPTASNGQAFGASPRSTSINVQAKGIVVGAAVGPNSGAYGWAGLTKNNEFAYTPGNYLEQSGASGAFAAAQSPLSIQTTYGGNHSLQAMAFR